MTINYTEKGAGLHDAIAAADHWLMEVDGTWASSDDAAVQVIIDSYSLADCQAEIVAKIDAHAKSLRDVVVANISPAEMASWSIKQAEAAAYTSSGADDDAPMLLIEAQARGVTVADLAAKVLGKGAALAQLEAAISGVSGRHADAVRATQTFAGALAYDWSAGWPAV